MPTVTPLVDATGYEPGDYVQEIDSGGQLRRYRLHIPPGYRPGEPVPLVINLHGFSTGAADQETLSGMSNKADEAGFVVVHPEAQGDPPGWSLAEDPQEVADVAFIRDLVEDLQQDLSIDPKRIFAVGMSNGGGMANRLACDLSDVVAAVASVAGVYPFSERCEPGRPIPVLAFHGTADQIAPYDGARGAIPPVRQWASAWANRNGCDVEPTITLRQGEVVGETWNNCEQGAVVILYTIAGRGHSWPGGDPFAGSDEATQDIDATDTIWTFFEAHTLPGTGDDD
jgi:polyhydroxybutyrate depolymerase